MKADQNMLIRSSGGTWSAPESAAYQDEAHLQQMLAEQPGWVPGVDEPAFTARELPTTAGPIDVCVVGSDGGLTVVECKLASSSEKRRMVVGQVIDYASAIWAEGSERFIERWQRRTDQDLRELLSDVALDRLFDNIESARIDLCLAVDEIDDDLRRLIEYLNKASRADVRVTAIQLAYARQGDLEILIPSTFGAELADTKGRAEGRLAEKWTVEAFVESLASTEDRALAQRAIELTQQAEGPQQSRPLWFGTKPNGGIYLRPGGVSIPPVWIWVNSSQQLTICGTWKTFRSVAHDDAYADLAQFLGQDHRSGASGVLLSTLDLEELWPTLLECGIKLHQTNQQLANRDR